MENWRGSATVPPTGVRTWQALAGLRRCRAFVRRMARRGESLLFSLWNLFIFYNILYFSMYNIQYSSMYNILYFLQFRFKAHYLIGVDFLDMSTLCSNLFAFLIRVFLKIRVFFFYFEIRVFFIYEIRVFFIFYFFWLQRRIFYLSLAMQFIILLIN